MNTEKLLKILIHKCGLKQGDKLIVGVSAGPDSVALLHFLSTIELGLKVTAVYVDHGLRPGELDKEKDLIKTLAHQFDIPYEIFMVDATSYKKKEKTSLEESCRNLRYEVFSQCKTKYGATAVAVAHTADDQAEEMLLRLFRGTGLSGLSGMVWRNNDIIRPFLKTPKDSILNYLQANDLSYCIDSSNSSRKFMRNRIRIDLLPELKKHYNPLLTGTLLQTADILQSDDDFINSFTDEELSNCATFTTVSNKKHPSATIHLHHFATLHKALQRRIIERICWFFATTPTFKHIVSLCGLAEQGRAGAELHLGNGLRVSKTSTRLIFTQPCGKKPFRGRHKPRQFEPTRLALGKRIRINHLKKIIEVKFLEDIPKHLAAGTLLIDADTIIGTLILRHHAPGEKFTPSGMQGRKKISRFLSDLKLDQAERNNYPVVTCNNEIVAVAGLRVDQNFSITAATKRVLQISWKDVE